MFGAGIHIVVDESSTLSLPSSGLEVHLPLRIAGHAVDYEEKYYAMELESKKPVGIEYAYSEEALELREPLRRLAFECAQRVIDYALGSMAPAVWEPPRSFPDIGARSDRSHQGAPLANIIKKQGARRFAEIVETGKGTAYEQQGMREFLIHRLTMSWCEPFISFQKCSQTEHLVHWLAEKVLEAAPVFVRPLQTGDETKESLPLESAPIAPHSLRWHVNLQFAEESSSPFTLRLRRVDQTQADATGHHEGSFEIYLRPGHNDRCDPSDGTSTYHGYTIVRFGADGSMQNPDEHFLLISGSRIEKRHAQAPWLPLLVKEALQQYFDAQLSSPQPLPIQNEAWRSLQFSVPDCSQEVFECWYRSLVTAVAAHLKTSRIATPETLGLKEDSLIAMRLDRVGETKDQLQQALDKEGVFLADACFTTRGVSEKTLAILRGGRWNFLTEPWKNGGPHYLLNNRGHMDPRWRGVPRSHDPRSESYLSKDVTAVILEEYGIAVPRWLGLSLGGGKLEPVQARLKASSRIRQFGGNRQEIISSLCRMTAEFFESTGEAEAVVKTVDGACGAEVLFVTSTDFSPQIAEHFSKNLPPRFLDKAHPAGFIVQERIRPRQMMIDGELHDWNLRIWISPYSSCSLPLLVRHKKEGGPVNISLGASAALIEVAAQHLQMDRAAVSAFRGKVNEVGHAGMNAFSGAMAADGFSPLCHFMSLDLIEQGASGKLYVMEANGIDSAADLDYRAVLQDADPALLAQFDDPSHFGAPFEPLARTIQTFARRRQRKDAQRRGSADGRSNA